MCAVPIQSAVWDKYTRIEKSSQYIYTARFEMLTINEKVPNRLKLEFSTLVQEITS
jgi:hypothetical protein